RGGFEAETVTNGIEAMAILAQPRFEVVVLDLLLPRVSGYDVLEWMQETNAALLPRVIILSATSPAIVLKHPIARRVFRVMQKPFDIENLLDVARACVSHGHEADPFVKVRMKSSQANADAGVLGVIAPQRDALNLVWSYGYEPEVITKYNPMALDAKLPMSRSVIEARPVWVHTRRELLDEFPVLEPTLLSRTRAVAAVPIVDGNAVSGSIGWSFVEEQAFDGTQQEILLSIAADCVPLSKTGG
ncbi:MAG TPA: response regulator, partial [Vicinamibacterales bacterium]